MPLTPDELAKLDIHLKSNGGLKCSLCGSGSWAIADLVACPVVQRMPDGSTVLGPQAIPMLPLLCVRCHRVEFFAWEPLAQIPLPFPADPPKE